MHVALVHHHVGGKAGGGGGVRLMLELGLGLARRGHRITVACHDHLPNSEFDYASGQIEIKSVREGISEIPDGYPALTRSYWLDMRKVRSEERRVGKECRGMRLGESGMKEEEVATRAVQRI